MTRHQDVAPASTPLHEKLGVIPTVGDGRLDEMAGAAGGVASMVNAAAAGALSAPIRLR